MIGDMPTISNASHAQALYSAINTAVPLSTFAGTTTSLTHTTAANQLLIANGGFGAQAGPGRPILPNKIPQPKKETTMQARRLVQVFIADPDENVPLDKSLLYSGEQKLTDLTDQELFFEIDMKSILETHNAFRITLINKKVKERAENLEPVKIRDLRMVVVDVATFS